MCSPRGRGGTVDALGSKSSSRKGVRVQSSPPPPYRRCADRRGGSTVLIRHFGGSGGGDRYNRHSPHVAGPSPTPSGRRRSGSPARAMLGASKLRILRAVDDLAGCGDHLSSISSAGQLTSDAADALTACAAPAPAPRSCPSRTAASRIARWTSIADAPPSQARRAIPHDRASDHTSHGCDGHGETYPGTRGAGGQNLSALESSAGSAAGNRRGWCTGRHPDRRRGRSWQCPPYLTSLRAAPASLKTWKSSF